MNNLALWALGIVLAITQLINLTYFEGLSSDFSDLALQVVAANASYNAPYTVVDQADGAWIVVNATLPENESYTLNVLSSSDGSGSYEETNDPSIIEVPYQEGFAQDFSNLVVAFVSPDGTATPATHSLIGMSEGRWAIIALARPPMAGETISFMAKVGDAPPTSETGVSSEDTLVEDGFGQIETIPPIETGPSPETALESGDSGNETTPPVEETASIRVFDAKGNEHKTEGKKGKNNKINFKLEGLPVREITFNGLNTPNSSLGLDFPKDVPAPDDRTWSQVYAIDPTALDFTSATVTVTAQGNALFKCGDWDFASRTCGGGWALMRDDLVPGENYDITITPEDPAFGEANITVIDVQSYPVVGGDWTVRFTTTGAANLSIRAVNGTTLDDSDPSADLNFLELRCGDMVLSPVWDDESKTVLYEDFYCADTGYETSRVLTSGAHHLEFRFGDDTDYANNDAGDLVVTNVAIAGSSPTDNLTLSWDVYHAFGLPIINFTTWRKNGNELLALYIPFEGSGNAYGATDYSDLANNATAKSVGATYSATGGFDGYGAYDFAGNNDYMSFSTTSFPTIGTGNFTLEAWIKTTDTTNWYNCIFSINSADPSFYTTTGDSLSIYDDGNFPMSGSNISISDGSWHHVAFVREGTGTDQLKFYLDGQALGTGTYDSDIPAASTLRLGYDGYSGEDFDGMIDEFRLWNVALPQEQILAHAQNKPHVIVSQMTELGQDWSGCVTPNDAAQDGLKNCSANVSITDELPAENIASCQVINASGNYALNTSLSGAPTNASPVWGYTCIKIAASDVAFDCNGYNITDDGSAPDSTSGIVLNGSLTNVTVRDCRGIGGYDTGIYVYDSNNSLFTNNSAFGIPGNGTVFGFYVGGASFNNTFSGNSLHDLIQQGFKVGSSATNNHMNGNSIYDSAVGFNVNGNDNTIDGNNVTNCASGIEIEGPANTTVRNNRVENMTSQGYVTLSGAAQNRFINNTARNCVIGFSVSNSGDLVANNTAFENADMFSGYGFRVGGTDCTYINNTAYNNSGHGFYVAFADRLNMTGSISYNNGLSGIFIGGANATLLNGSHLYNNGYDLRVDAAGSGISVSAVNAIFDSPAGAFANYTNLSLNDTLGTSDAYSINWSAEPAPIPVGNVSIKGKFVNITAVSGAVSIDSVTLHWLQQDVSPYNESTFSLYEYNSSGWTLLNGTPDTSQNLISYSPLVPHSTYALLGSNQDLESACVNLSDAGTFGEKVVNLGGVYYVNNNTQLCTGTYTTTLSMLYINSSNIVLDCNGATLDGDGDTSGSDFGINFNGSDNVTIRNCIVRDFYDGVYLPADSDYDRIINVTSHDNYYSGFLSENSDYAVFENNTARDNSNRGFYFYYSDYFNVTNNIAFLNTYKSSSYGIYSVYQDNSSYINNTVRGYYYGFYPYYSTYSVWYNNTAYNDTYGFFIYNYNSYCNFTNNTANRNTNSDFYIWNRNSNIKLENNSAFSSPYGIYNRQTYSTNLTNNHLFNHSIYDLYAAPDTFGGPYNLYVSNLILDNPYGNYTNFTNLSFNDTPMTLSTSFYMKWSSNTSALPSGRVTFANKFAEMVNNTGISIIESMVWHWTDGEVGTQDESRFELWKYNASAGWTLLNDTPNATSNILSLRNLTFASIYGILERPNVIINGCMEISSPSAMSLGANLDGANLSDSNYPGLSCIKISSSNVLIDCSGFSITNNGTAGTTMGILVNSTPGQPYTNVTIQNCPTVSGYTYGAYLPYAQSSVLNSSLYGNSYNLNASSGNVTAANASLFNATVSDFTYSNNGASATTLNLANVTFRRPAGDSTNYTSISLNDSVAASSSYSMNWSAEPAAVPSGNVSIRGKFLNITALSGSVSIDRFVLHWAQSEVPPYNESTFSLYEYDSSGWTLLNGTPDRTLNEISSVSLVPHSVYALLASNQTLEGYCVNLSDPTTYEDRVVNLGGVFYVNYNITLCTDTYTTTNSMLYINSSNLALNCNSSILDGDDGGSDIGILINGSDNVTVKNCIVRDFLYGVYLSNGSDYNTIRNVTSYSNSMHGFYGNYANYTTFENNTAYGHTSVLGGCGFYINTSKYNNLTDNVAYNNNISIYIDGSFKYGYHRLVNNSVINSTWRGIYIMSYENTLINNSAIGTVKYDGFNVWSSNFIVFINNSASGNARTGFYLYSSDECNFTDNTAYGNGEYGYVLRYGSNDNILGNNSAYDNGVGGYYLDLAHDTRIENTTVYNNGNYAFYIYQTFGTNLTNVRVYNHTTEFYVEYVLAGHSVSFRNVTMDNPSGTMQNFTRLDLYDYGTDDTAFTMDWTGNPPSMPSGRIPFADKFVNIVNTTGNITFDSINWTWDDSELAGFDENQFEVWKFNSSGWSNMNATLNASANLLTLFNVSSFSDYGIMENINGSCMVINASGEYNLTQNLTGAPNAASSGYYACLLINADNVLVDCHGFSITHDDSANTAGIMVNATPGGNSNITIRNCTVSHYSDAIVVDGNTSYSSNVANLSSNILTENGQGIRVISTRARAVLYDNLVANNTRTGYMIDDYFGGTIDMSRDRFLGNGKDVNYTAGMSSLSISINDVVFGSPDASYGANASISHSSGSRSWGIIDWVPAPSPPASGLYNFYNKSVNITPEYFDWPIGTGVFDVTIKWNATEAGSAIQEAGIQMWLINDSGSYLLSNAPNLTTHSISASPILTDTSDSSVIALYRGTDCPVLTSPGVYTLENDLSGAPNTGSHGHMACVLITTDNVLLDCAGYNITHDDSADTAGIMINAPEDSNWNNITIMNCNVRDYESAVLADSTSSLRKIINLTNNTLVSNAYGINIPLGYAYVNTTGNLIANNTVAGLIDKSYFGEILNFTRDSFLGNGVDIAYPSGGSGFSLTLSDVLLGSASADYAANVSLDHWGDHDWGNISWVTSPAPPTAGLVSFANKSFNISYIPYYFPTTRDYSVTLKWTPSEGAAIDESTIAMWLFNESGSFLLNDTPDLSSRGISASMTFSDVNNNTIIGLFNGFSDYNVSDCRVITSNGTYTQTANIAGAPNDASEILPASFACVKIAASNVVFDCAGFNITYDGSVDPDSTFGILANGTLTNVTIRNCPSVDNYTYGVYLYDTSESAVTNTTATHSATSAFVLSYSSNNNVSYCSAPSNYGSGFYLVGGSSGNNLSFNLARDSCQTAGAGCAGFHLDGSTDGALYDNVLYMNNATDMHGPNNPSGIQIIDTVNTLVKNNRAENNDFFGFNLESYAPIYANNLTGNLAYNNSANGFRIWSSYTYLAGNNATMNGGTGYFLSAAMGFPSEYSVMADNTAYNNSNYGYEISARYSNITGNLADLNGIGSMMGGDGFSITSSGYDLFDNNNATSNGRDGFRLIGASGGGGPIGSYANITNILAFNNSQNGFNIVDDHTFVANCSAIENGAAGFYFTGFDNGTGYNPAMFDIVINNTAHGNARGIHLYDITESTLDGNTMFDNGYDFVAEADLSPLTYNMTGSLFLNPSGTLANFTNLSINDSASSEAYTINWTTNSSALPAGLSSFAQKFVNISAQSGSPSIDSAAWSWADSELAGYNESRFELWKYDSSSNWTNMNATLSTAANTLNVTNLVPGSDYGILQFNDTIPPSIALLFPAPNANFATSSVYFGWNATDNMDASMLCNLTINGTVNASDITSPNNTIANVSVSGLSVGYYLWNVTCADDEGNANTSETRNFTILSTANLTPVDLGSAANFVILAGTAITGSINTNLVGDVGLSPTGGAAITLLQCDDVSGAIYDTDGGYAGGGGNDTSCQLTDASLLTVAKNDLTTAYNDAAGRAPTTIYGPIYDLGGQTLTPGIYNDPTSFGITGNLTLDAQGNASAVFVFQAGSTLITEPGSNVILINGAQASNVFWQVGSSATLGTDSVFYGNILALTAITLNPGTEMTGRLLAQNSFVTLNDNNVTLPSDGPEILFVPPTDDSGTVVSRDYILANVTATGNVSLDNITIYLYNATGSLLNSSNGTASPLFVNFTGLPDGLYYFNATACDAAGGCNSTETRNVTITSNCPIITSPGDYYQAQNYTGAPNDASEVSGSAVACVKIAASDVVWDCQGNTITNNGTPTAIGVLLNGSLTNVTVMNCPSISGYMVGAYVFNSENSTIRNVSADGSQNCFEVFDPYGTNFGRNLLDNDSAHNCSNAAFYIQSSNYNNITNSVAYDFGSQGFLVSGPLGWNSEYNLLVNNTARDSPAGGFVMDSNSLRTTLVNNTAYNVSTGFATSLSNWNNFTANHAYWNYHGFQITSQDTVLDGNDAFNNTDAAFFLSSSERVNLTNNIAYANNNSGWSGTFYLLSSKNNSLVNNSAYNNTYFGFYLVMADDNILENNSAWENSYGLYVASSTRNRIANFTSRSNQFGAMVASADGNNLTDSLLHGNSIADVYSLTASGNLYRNNTLRDSPAGIQLLSGSENNTLDGNEAYNESYGFWVSESNGNTLLSNRAHECLVGIVITQYANLTNLTSNLAYNCSNNGIQISYANNTYSYNNSAYQNGQYGIMLYSANYTSSYFDKAYDNAAYQLLLMSVSDSNLFSNTLLYGGQRGAEVDGSSNNSFIGITAANSSSLIGAAYNFYIYDSDTTYLDAPHFYNSSGWDFGVYSTGTARSFDMVKAWFDSPPGNYANFTQMYVKDSVEADTSYAIKWTRNSTALPASHFSFAEKWVDVTTFAGPVSIDEINWTWTDGEVTAGGYNESKFELWKYNITGWTIENGTPDISANTLGMYAMDPASEYGILENNFSARGCMEINASGSYSMNESAFGAPFDAAPLVDFACIKIEASDVIFDCAGYNITYDGTASGVTYGILLNGSISNVTVRNCPNVTNYTYGAYIYDSDANSISNVTAISNSDAGFKLDGSGSNNVSGCLADWSGNSGFILESGSDGNLLSGNNASNSASNGFAVSDSVGNSLTGNIAHHNGFGYYISAMSGYLFNNTAHDNENTGFLGTTLFNLSFLNNTARDNGLSGVDLSGINDSQISGTNAHGNGGDGVLVYIATATNLTGNTAYMNGNNGLTFASSQNGLLENNTAFGNSQCGLGIASANATIIHTHLFNDTTMEACINAGKYITMTVNFVNLTIDSPAGVFENYTALNMTDTLGPQTGVNINWTSNSSALPSDRFSFAQKFVNISAFGSPAPSIDSIEFTWQQAEVVTPYNENLFELWEYNSSGWTILNYTPDTTLNTLGLANMYPHSDYAILQNNYTGCVNLSDPTTWGTRIRNESGVLFVNENITLCHDTYYMDVDMFAVSFLFMNKSNIHLDCNDSIIDGVDQNGRCIQVGYSGMGADPPVENDTIMNCYVRNYGYGILAQDTHNSTFLNNTAFNMSWNGFDIYLGGNNTIVDARASFSPYGFYFHSTQNNSLSNASAANNTQFGLLDEQSAMDRFTNVSASFNELDGFRADASTLAAFSGCAALDNGGSGFYLKPGKNPGHTFHTISASVSSGNALDGFTVFHAFSNRFISSNASGNGASGIYAETALNTTIDPSWFCNNLDGIVINSSSGSIIDDSVACNNSRYGIYVLDSNNTLINRSRAYNNSYGLFQVNGNYTNLTASNVTNNTNDGVRFDAGSEANALNSSFVCFNGLDINNQGVSDNGTSDYCDSFINWAEGGHPGCLYTCSSMWHRFFGNVSGNIVLTDSAGANLVYSWNASGFNVYFADYDSAVSWYDLQAIGRDTANAGSSNDFTELDTAFGTSSYGDNINNTYSSDGSAPLETRNYTVYGRPIGLVPVANSTAFNTTFDTGILWDMSDDAGNGEYDATDKETTVWVVAVNSSTADVYGTYDYLIQVPYTLSAYEGGNDLVSIYLELR